MSKLTLRRCLCGLLFHFLVVPLASHTPVVRSERNDQAASLLDIRSNVTVPMFEKRFASDDERTVWCRQFCWNWPRTSSGLSSPYNDNWSTHCWRCYSDPSSWQEESSASSILGLVNPHYWGDPLIVILFAQMLLA
ncbi:MAG: hypothetical protein J3Q66DRAFT_339102 [Benniella sp.]|nr:MAG: hypothetical protein J3Q66DRAFT_339102 [Benniella sp.]